MADFIKEANPYHLPYVCLSVAVALLAYFRLAYQSFHNLENCTDDLTIFILSLCLIYFF